jgi:hypothetical protein
MVGLVALGPPYVYDLHILPSSIVPLLPGRRFVPADFARTIVARRVPLKSRHPMAESYSMRIIW